MDDDDGAVAPSERDADAWCVLLQSVSKWMSKSEPKMSERHEAEETRGRKAIASDTMNVVRNERNGHKGVFVSVSFISC